MRRQVTRRPLRSFGSTTWQNNGASVRSEVKAQMVMESAASKLSSCTMTQYAACPHNCCPQKRSRLHRASFIAPILRGVDEGLIVMGVGAGGDRLRLAAPCSWNEDERTSGTHLHAHCLGLRCYDHVRPPCLWLHVTQYEPIEDQLFRSGTGTQPRPQSILCLLGEPDRSGGRRSRRARQRPAQRLGLEGLTAPRSNASNRQGPASPVGQ